MKNIKLSFLAKQRSRCKLGRFVSDGNWATKRYNQHDMQKAFNAGRDSAYSTIPMSLSRRFEIFLKQKGFL